ncbi:hypothetical protein PR048_010692 [Dryococelus australis]|uniref:PiggyBac transposable element-derived protein domain-containing protein n=1 Tax=Dryococelus australis TaxID=614101 RepID=A0ABQ9I3G1_9NEOP|nr:hypothetical protein PR048_010692 [Dryococelus australis]
MVENAISCSTSANNVSLRSTSAHDQSYSTSTHDAPSCSKSAHDAPSCSTSVYDAPSCSTSINDNMIPLSLSASNYTSPAVPVLKKGISKRVSNLYATQKNKILNLKKNELNSFIGTNFFMDFQKLPNWRHYWSTGSLYSVPVVHDTMSRNHFDEILRYLHISDNGTMPDNNKDKTRRGR